MRLQRDLKAGLAEEGAVFIHQARSRQLAVVRVEFHTHAVSSVLERGHHRRRGAVPDVDGGGLRVEWRRGRAAVVASERKHLDEARGEFERIRRGMEQPGGLPETSRGLSAATPPEHVPHTTRP